jgi:3-oxoacyl-[acyl-carrier protein] reductase
MHRSDEEEPYMDLMLAGKVAMVSGSSRGIGFHIARDLAVEGCNVVINGRDADRLVEAKTAIAGAIVDACQECRVAAVVGDVTQPHVARAFLDTALDTFGQVDILVNNVGGSNPKSLVETTDEDWEEAFAFNLLHAVRLSRMVVPEMVKVGGGAILNVASIAGRESGSAMTYNAAKAALISFSKALAQQVARDNIRANSIAPGSIYFPGGVWERRMAESPDRLEGFVQANMPLGRFGRPEEISAVATFMVSPRASLVNGACWNVDGGQSRSNI